ncbi:MAG TPA: hypothetical protein VF397_17210 [Pyrinomonadaceae bacterium]
MKDLKNVLLVVITALLLVTWFVRINSTKAQEQETAAAEKVLVVNPSTRPVPVAGTVSLSGLVGVNNFPSAVGSAKQGWEYMIVPGPPQDIAASQARLNELGLQNWEAVGLITNGFVMKRPR